MQNEKTRNHTVMLTGAIRANSVTLVERSPIEEIVAELSQIIGPKFTAYVASVEEPELIEKWTLGIAAPSDIIQSRLRLTYRVSKVINDHYQDRDTVQAWLQGKNPDLGDKVAMVMIRTGEDPDRLESVLVSAAQRFIEK